MRTIDYRSEYNRLLTPEIIRFLTFIHEQKGQQLLYTEVNKDALSDLLEIAKIQSTEASNRIEGIITTEARLRQLVMDKTTPQNRNEQEIMGYRDVLNIIHESYDFIPLRPNIILQLHRDLYKFNGPSSGGNFKNADNVIAETFPDGTKHVRFQPVPAWETPSAIETLCDKAREALQDESMDSLLLIPVIILDFLCIHPFNDGNGRMSRLLTLLLLYQSRYPVGRYISIEKTIADTKENYYEALRVSSAGWHDAANDYRPFVQYMLGVIAGAYREFFHRVNLLVNQRMLKSERVAAIIREQLGKISKSEIVAMCPGISEITIQRALAELVKNGNIIKHGGGRYTYYTWNDEKQ